MRRLAVLVAVMGFGALAVGAVATACLHVGQVVAGDGRRRTRRPAGWSARSDLGTAVVVCSHSEVSCS
jgi:hypothetical protein